MSIRKKQLSRLVDKRIEEELKNGTYPAPTTIYNITENALRRNNLGNPLMQPVWSKFNEKAKPEEYNQMLEDMTEDFKLIYEQLIQQAGDLESNFMYYLKQAEALETELDELNAELENLVLVQDNTNSYVYTLWDNFLNNSKLNMPNCAGSVERNKLCIGYSHQNNVKFPIYNANINFQLIKTKGLIGQNTIDSIDKIYDEYIDTGWKYQATSTDNGKMQGILTIEFEEAIKVNMIKFQMNSPKKTGVLIKYTPDNGINWFTLDQKDIDKEHEFHFEKRNVTGFEIWLSKEEADILELGGNNSAIYTYLFSIIDLSIFYEGYLAQGHFETIDIPIDTNKDLERVALWTDEFSPTGTEIEYRLVINDKSLNVSPIQYKDPKYQQIINLVGMTDNRKESFIMKSVDSPAHYELSDLRNNEIRFYKLGEVTEEVKDDTLVLYKGKNTYTKDTWNRIFTVNDFTNDLAEFESLLGKPNLSGYLMINDEAPSLLVKGEILSSQIIKRYSINAYYDSSSTEYSHPICSNGQIAVYHNNTLIFKGAVANATRINYSISKGWNKFDFFIIQNIGECTFDIGFNPSDSKMCYSFKNPMEKVNMFDLTNNTLASDKNKYAIFTKDSKKFIVLNHFDQDIFYDLYYKFTEHKIDNIKLIIDMKRNEQITSLSPILKSYQIRFM